MKLNNYIYIYIYIVQALNNYYYLPLSTLFETLDTALSH